MSVENPANPAERLAHAQEAHRILAVRAADGDLQAKRTLPGARALVADLEREAREAEWVAEHRRAAADAQAARDQNDAENALLLAAVAAGEEAVACAARAQIALRQYLDLHEELGRLLEGMRPGLRLLPERVRDGIAWPLDVAAVGLGTLANADPAFRQADGAFWGDAVRQERLDIAGYVRKRVDAMARHLRAHLRPDGPEAA